MMEYLGTDLGLTLKKRAGQSLWEEVRESGGDKKPPETTFTLLRYPRNRKSIATKIIVWQYGRVHTCLGR